MTSLTRRELLIGGAAIVAAGALPGAAFAAEAAEHSGFSMDTNIKGERSMTTITTKDGTMIYYKTGSLGLTWMRQVSPTVSSLTTDTLRRSMIPRASARPQSMGSTTVDKSSDFT